jgi:hypothetical protein
MENENDRQIVSMILGAIPLQYTRYTTERLSSTLAKLVFPRMVETGKYYLVKEPIQEPHLLKFDGDRKWDLALSLEKDLNGYLIHLYLICGTESKSIKDALYFNNCGYVFWSDGTVNHFDAHHLYYWLPKFLDETITIPFNDINNLIISIKELDNKPQLTYPEDIIIKEMSIEPQPLLKIHGDDKWRKTLLSAEVNFLYENQISKYGSKDKSIYDSKENVIYRINEGFHKKCLDFLFDLDFKPDTWNRANSFFNFRKSNLTEIVSTLLNNGWKVEGKNGQIKRPGNFSFSVNSGIDWFDVQGERAYDGESVSIPEILDALKRKQDFIELGDGTLGILPIEWLKKNGRLAAMGKADDDTDTIRFKKSQALLVDLLLAD